MIKAGYLKPDFQVEFDGKSWLVDKNLVSYQVCLSDYPCYALNNSDLGEYVVVLGDEEFKHARERYLDTAPDVVSSLWFLCIDDAFYFGVLSDKASLVPLAINAYDFELRAKEMHVYISNSDDVCIVSVAIFDKDTLDIDLSFYKNEDTCVSKCCVYASFLTKGAILASVIPDICGFAGTDQVEYVQQMGSVDLHLTDNLNTQVTGSDVSTLAKNAVSYLRGIADKKTFIPELDKPPFKSSPNIVSTVEFDDLPDVLAISSPQYTSISSLFHDKLDTDFNNGVLFNGYNKRVFLAVGIFAASQCISITCSESSVSRLLSMISDDSKESLEALLSCTKLDFIFPDAVVFWLDHNFVLGDVDLTKLDSILDCDFSESAYERLATSFNSPFSLDYAKLLQNKKICFRTGKHGRGTLPSIIPFATARTEKSAVLLAYAYQGTTGTTHLEPSLKYRGLDMLLAGPFCFHLAYLWIDRVNATSMYSAPVSTKLQTDVEHSFKYLHALWVKLDQKINPAYYDDGHELTGRAYKAVEEEYGKKKPVGFRVPLRMPVTFYTLRSWFAERDCQSMNELGSTYPFFSADVPSGNDHNNFYYCALDWLLLVSGLSPLVTAIPRGLSVPSLTRRSERAEKFQGAIYHLVALWQRLILGTLSSCNDATCSFDFGRSYPKAFSADHIIHAVSSDACFPKFITARTFEDLISKDTGSKYLAYGWCYDTTKSIHSRDEGWICTDTACTNFEFYISDDILGLNRSHQCCITGEKHKSRYGDTFDIGDKAVIFVSALEDGFTVIPHLATSVLFTGTYGSCDYINARLNAVLSLSDMKNPDSFYNKYVEAYKLFISVFAPMMKSTLEETISTRVLLTCSAIQEKMHGYNFDYFAEAVSQLGDMETLPARYAKQLLDQGIITMGLYREFIDDINAVPADEEDLDDVFATSSGSSDDMVSFSSEHEDTRTDAIISAMPKAPSGLCELQPRFSSIKLAEEAMSAESTLDQAIDEVNPVEDTESSLLDDLLGITGEGSDNTGAGSDNTEGYADEDFEEWGNSDEEDIPEEDIVEFTGDDSLLDSIFGGGSRVMNNTAEPVENEASVVENEASVVENIIEPVENTGKAVENQPSAVENQSSAVENQPSAVENQSSAVESAQGTMQEPASPVENTQGTMQEPASPVESAQGTAQEPASPVESAQGTAQEPASPVENTQGTAQEPASKVFIYAPPVQSTSDTADSDVEELIYNPADESKSSDIVKESLERDRRLASKGIIIMPDNPALRDIQFIEPSFKSLIDFCKANNAICYFNKNFELCLSFNNQQYITYGVFRNVKEIQRDISRGNLVPSRYALSRISLNNFTH